MKFRPKRTILLAGAGRSGTTWLGKLMDASPSVFYKHEPDNVEKLSIFALVPSRLDLIVDNDGYCPAFQDALERTFWQHGLMFLASPELANDFLRSGPWKVVNLALRGIKKMGFAQEPTLKLRPWMFRRSVDEVSLVIKSVVSNMRLAWVHQHFPEIKQVLIIRHPGGYLNSWLNGKRDHGWSKFGKKGRLNQAIIPLARPEHEKYLDSYENGTDFERELIYWIIANETPLLQLGEKSGLMTVVYEDLCENPQKIMSQVYEHCEIPFLTSTQEFIEQTTSRQEDGFHSVFKDPRVAAEKWRSELSQEQIEIVERYLAGSILAPLWQAP
jgi:Sulfotransferase family